MGLLDKFKNMFTEEVEEEEEVVEAAPQIKPNIVEQPEIKKRKVEYEPPVQVSRTRMSSQMENEALVKKYVMEEEPIKHEEKKVAPVEEKKVLKREEKFVFPVYFDDKDFEKIEEKPKKVEPKKEPPKKEVYGTKIEQKETPKVFKPTPIISPIYGVLDKNYSKEDISSKKVVHTEYRDPSKPLTIDDVRRKAYGTLEDDLEKSLFAKSSIFMEPDTNKEEKEENEHNLLTDLVDDNEYNSIDEFLNTPTEEYKSKHGQVEEKDDIESALDDLEKVTTKKLNKTEKVDEYDDETLDDLLAKAAFDENEEENLTEEENSNEEISNDKDLDDYIMNNTIENEENKDEDEDLTQSDLFNLIDSMYEKGEDE